MNKNKNKNKIKLVQKFNIIINNLKIAIQMMIILKINQQTNIKIIVIQIQIPKILQQQILKVYLMKRVMKIHSNINKMKRVILIAIILHFKIKKNLIKG